MNDNDSIPTPGKGVTSSDLFGASADELKEAKALVLLCARKHGELDAKEGVTIPPAEICDDTPAARMLLAAWSEGWHAAQPNAKLRDADPTK